jgi:hypothetical protein
MRCAEQAEAHLSRQLHRPLVGTYMDSPPIARQIFQKLMIPTEIEIAAIYSVSKIEVFIKPQDPDESI